jgi:hypothetical protein
MVVPIIFLQDASERRSDGFYHTLQSTKITKQVCFGQAHTANSLISFPQTIAVNSMLGL